MQNSLFRGFLYPRYVQSLRCFGTKIKMSVLSRLANPKIREFAVRLRQPVSISALKISSIEIA